MHAAGLSDEQPCTQLVLKPLDLPADCRLRDAKRARGTADIAVLRDGNKIFDLREAHIASLACLLHRASRKRGRSNRHWTQVSRWHSLRG
jgi:hypothetical protein